MRNVGFAALGVAVMLVAGDASAQAYTDRTGFLAASGASLIEDFESVPANQRDIGLSSLVRPNISFAPTTGGQNVYVYSATPTSADWRPGAIPANSLVLTADGLEHIGGALNTPASALGFNVILSDVGPVVVSFYSNATLLGSLIFPVDTDNTNNYTFAGFISASPITRFTFDTSGVNRYDTGLDNIYATPFSATGVPEPASWITLIAGFGLLGGAMRGRRSGIGRLPCPD